jgi:hypothetical protein
MASTYRPRSRRVGERLFTELDDFMSWFLFGHETWLVATLKGVALFLYVYFLLAYVPNYVYYGVTQYIPFLSFSAEVGFIIASGVGGGNFLILIVVGIWTQAARGRRGFAWILIRMIDLLQVLFVFLLLIPLLAFNMAGGSFIAINPGQELFPLQAIGFGTLVAGLGAASLVYFYFEFRRVSRREARAAADRSAALQAG